MNPPTPRDLRRHFTRHNVQALGMAAASAVGAVMLWGLLVGAAYWFTLLAATIERGTDPERSLEIFDARDMVGPRFWPTVGLGAVSLVVLALAARRWRWGSWLRDSRFFIFWVVLEVLLFAPSVLLALWGNLRAFVWLRAGERQLAWALLQAVGTRQWAGEPLALTEAAAEIGATERSLPGLNRALFALQLTNLVTLRERTGEGWFLTLAGDEARALCGWPAETGLAAGPEVP